MPSRTQRHLAGALLAIALGAAAAPAQEPAPRDTRPLGAARQVDASRSISTQAPDAGPGTLRMAVSLAGVLVVIFAGAAIFKRAVSKSPSLAASMGAGGKSPAGIIEIIGRYPVGRAGSLVLLRLDRRVLLLSQSSSSSGRGALRSGAASLSTLCEITAPDEVASILAKARDDEGESLAARFQSLLSGMSQDPDAPQPAPPPADPEPTHPPEIVVRTPAWAHARGGAA